MYFNLGSDIYKKSIGRSLPDIEGLTRKEVVGAFRNQPVSPAFFHGSKLIDGVWATLDISVCNTAIMLAGYGIGDHRLFVINFAKLDVIGISR